MACQYVRRVPRNKASNNESSEVVGRVLREARESAGITQQDAAMRANMDRAYVSEVENGKRSISLDRLFLLCNAIGVPAAKIVASMERKLRHDKK